MESYTGTYMLIWSHSEALLQWKATQAPICLSGVTLKLFFSGKLHRHLYASVESYTGTYMLIWSHSEALLQWKAHRNLYASVESYTGTYMLIWSHSEALLQWKAAQARICLSGDTLKLFFSGKLHRHLYAYLESF